MDPEIRLTPRPVSQKNIKQMMDKTKHSRTAIIKRMQQRIAKNKVSPFIELISNLLVT